MCWRSPAIPPETWRDAPPDEPDLRLAPEGGFRDACVAQAARRSIRQFPTVEPLRAWGVILASTAARQGAERQAARLRHRHAAVLGGEEISYSHARAPGIPRRLHMAQIGRDSRAEAERLCARLRADGGACMVLRN